MARQYRFLTTWLLESPREPVWDAIYESEEWPRWWHGVRVAEQLSEGDARGVGERGRYVWRGAIPYAVEFEVVTTSVEPPRLLEGEATGGLEGTGRWRLFEQDGVTAVLYEWNVKTTKRWMNALAPALRPVFEWNHDQVMRNGGAGLAELLGCRLLASD
jgi:uncharacterized protein YndB with AHSA1/START domain